MVPAGKVNATPDPIELLDEKLECAWREICEAYDVIAALPPLDSLFEAADLARPEQAAEMVVVNMLLEVMACVDRFSPWYTWSARDYGLTRTRDPVTGRRQWILTLEGLRRRQTILEVLAALIRENGALIQMLIEIDRLMESGSPDDICVVATCACTSPRYIHVQRSILDATEIVCDRCRESFYEVEDLSTNFTN